MTPDLEVRRWRAAAALLAVALLAALVALSRPQRASIDAPDRPLVERTAREVARGFRWRTEAVLGGSDVRVVRTAEGPCVEIRPYERGDVGRTVTCYDTNGRFRSRVVSGGF
jgi:hypothetical protein